MNRIWMLGDNVNTDVIIPGRYNVTTDRAQLARYCLCEVLPEFSQQVQAGDVVMAGHNFGCGSSREHAPAALLACGVQVVIAQLCPHLLSQRRQYWPARPHLRRCCIWQRRW